MTATRFDVDTVRLTGSLDDDLNCWCAPNPRIKIYGLHQQHIPHLFPPGYNGPKVDLTFLQNALDVPVLSNPLMRSPLSVMPSSFPLLPTVISSTTSPLLNPKQISMRFSLTFAFPIGLDARLVLRLLLQARMQLCCTIRRMTERSRVKGPFVWTLGASGNAT